MIKELFGSEIFRSILLDLILVLISVACGQLTKWLSTKTKLEKATVDRAKLDTKILYAAMAVRFVEQTYAKHNSETKFNIAAEWLNNRGSGLGLKFTPGELKGLIEAALKELSKSVPEVRKE